MKEKELLKRIAAQNRVFRAAVYVQKVAIEQYNKAKKAEEKAFSDLIRANQRVDKEKYVLVCVAIGQKPKEQGL
jgi:hypothetical protein